jgi:amicyanin
MKKLLFVLLMAAVLIAGCTQPPAGNPPPGNNSNGNPPLASGNAVTIQNFAFNPQTITISVGETVTWTNQDSAPHSVMDDPGLPDVSGLSSAVLSKGGSYSFTFDQAGTWNYYCSIHPSMKGTVVVQ